jgi:hypothetical protein
MSNIFSKIGSILSPGNHLNTGEYELSVERNKPWLAVQSYYGIQLGNPPKSSRVNTLNNI